MILYKLKINQFTLELIMNRYIDLPPLIVMPMITNLYSDSLLIQSQNILAFHIGLQ